MRTEYNTNLHVLKTGFWSSVALSSLTLITFALAMMAIPPSGPYCPGNCMEYPYSGSLAYFPRDYYWIFFALFQLITYLIFMISIHFITPSEKKIYSFIAVVFATIASGILLSDYFIQFSVVPISLMKGETDGIALISQYNGHGIFIAMEELGYIIMGLSFLFLTPVINSTNRLERTIRCCFPAPFILLIATFAYYTVRYGLDRNYRFEVAAISINWLALIILGVLMAFIYKRELNKLDHK